jgi:hypothetical protein
VVRKVVSGGQTGADRGALDAAIEMNVPHGGFCPRGRLAEDGPIPEKYQLEEMASTSYAHRTEANVRNSDGTLLITRGPATGGSALTARLASELGKPFLQLDLSIQARGEAIASARTWLEREDVRILNVAGPRGSGCPGIADEVRSIVVALLAD